jgi:hypothetical protein
MGNPGIVKLGDVLGEMLPRAEPVTPAERLSMPATPESSPSPTEAEKMKRVRQATTLNMERVLERHGVPQHYRKARLADFPQAIADGLREPAPSPGLLITGPNGVGKTWLATAAFGEWLPFSLRSESPPIWLQYASSPWFSAWWLSVPFFLSAMRRSFNVLPPGWTTKKLEALLNEPHLLVLDDLLAGHTGTDWAQSELFLAIEGRLCSEKVTIATIHERIADVYRRDGHLGSRLSAFREMRLEGRDRRVKGTADEQYI